MPLNIPSGTAANVTYGPALLFVGATGATPSTDVGFISEDGISVELATEMGEISQGNPKLPEIVFNQAQSARVVLTSIEWDMDRFAEALNAGNTTVTGTEETLSWGGEPCPTEVAVHVQHQMCSSGDTMNVYVWRAVGEGGLVLPFVHDPHNFEFAYKALRATTTWAGVSLPSNEQLIRVERTL